MKSPFALRAELHGPQTPRQNSAWFITATVGVFVGLAVLGGALLVTP